MSQYVGPALVRSLYQSEAALAGIYGALHGGTLDVAAWSGDLYYGGKGRIYGTAYARQANGQQIPLAGGKVRLHLDAGGALLREARTGAAGQYEFDYLAMTLTYTVVGVDPTGVYSHGDAVTGVVPEAMP